MNKEIPLLTLILDEKELDYPLIFDLLCEEELLLPFNGDHLIEFYSDDEKVYIPIFTDDNQITSELKYTRLDRVKLKIVIRDIFSSGKYYAIVINPYTHDLILNNEVINILKKKCGLK